MHLTLHEIEVGVGVGIIIGIQREALATRRHRGTRSRLRKNMFGCDEWATNHRTDTTSVVW